MGTVRGVVPYLLACIPTAVSEAVWQARGAMAWRRCGLLCRGRVDALLCLVRTTCGGLCEQRLRYSIRTSPWHPLLPLFVYMLP